MKTILIYWLLSSLGIFGISYVMPGVRIRSYGTALVVAAVYGVLNYLLFKLFLILAFPFVVLTFGLFVFVINAFLLYITDKLIDDFEIKNFLTTIVMAVLLSIVHSGIRYVLYR